MAIPCYVSGKGMYATARTRQFKVTVIEKLEVTGMGYDTRYRYYQQQFSTMALSDLAQMICDPIEYYDLDWEAYQVRCFCTTPRKGAFQKCVSRIAASTFL